MTLKKDTTRKKKRPVAKKKSGPNHDDETRYSFKKMEDLLNDFWEFKYNEITNTIEYKSLEWDNWKELDEREMNDLFRWIRNNMIRFGMANLVYLLYSNFVPKYNPFIDYFNNLPEWDGKDHIGDLCRYIKVKKQDRFNTQLRKMLIRTIACGIDKEYFNKQIFVLFGEAQHQGKSSFVRWLCPPDLQRYYTESFNSDKDKDSALAICENFMINIDELAGLHRFEINKLKSTLSKQYEKIRLPFAKRAQPIYRTASFFGTTNERDFLTDVTGNVRWLCFEVDSIDWKYKEKIDITKLWSQVYHLYKNGAEMNLTADEIREGSEENFKHQIVTMEMDFIDKHLEQSEEGKGTFYTASDIVVHLQKLEGYSIKITNIGVGKAMTFLGHTQSAKWTDSEGKRQPRKGYWVKCRNRSTKVCYCNICEANNGISGQQPEPTPIVQASLQTELKDDFT